jgi:hypothetical protein
MVLVSQQRILDGFWDVLVRSCTLLACCNRLYCDVVDKNEFLPNPSCLLAEEKSLTNDITSLH